MLAYWRHGHSKRGTQPRCQSTLGGQDKGRTSCKDSCHPNDAQPNKKRLDVPVCRHRHEETEQRQLHGKHRVQVQSTGDMAVCTCEEVEIEGVVQLLKVTAERADE